MITDYNVGDRVVLTQKNIKTMWDSNKSCCTPNYPHDSFIKKLEKKIGWVGTVTKRFRPGYEMNVTFGDGTTFHMKDNWVDRCEDEGMNKNDSK